MKSIAIAFFSILLHVVESIKCPISSSTAIWIEHPSNGACYGLTNTQASQSECALTCSNLTSSEKSAPLQSSLCEISSASENAFIATNFPHFEYWIGFYRNSSGGWLWPSENTSSTSQYRNWEQKQPDDFCGSESCAVMTKDGFWDDRDCRMAYL
jgi:hypothetical protein